MSIRRLLPYAVIAAVVALSAPPAAADVLRVPKDHATIQAAVDAAGAGDEVLVTGGSHAERVLLHQKSQLTLRMTGGARLDGKSAAEVGVSVVGCVGIELSGVRVRRSAGDALAVEGSAGVRVVDADLRQIGSDGVTVTLCQDVELVGLRLAAIGGSGVQAAGAVRLLVEDVVARDLGGSGLVLGQPGLPVVDVAVRENRIDRAAGDGLVLLASDGVVAGNHVRRVEGHGLVTAPFAGSSGLQIEDNVVARVDGIGLAIGGREHGLARNDVLRSGLGGLVLAGAGHHVEDGRIVRAGFDGVLLVGVPPADGGEPGQHVLERILVKRAQRDGIVLGGNAPANRLQANVVLRPAADGYQVESTANDVLENVCRGAGLNGFEMHEGGNTVRFNEATGSAAFDLQDLAGEAGNLYVENVFPKVNVF